MNLRNDPFARWNDLAEQLWTEIQHLAHMDDVFWQIQAIISANADVNKAEVFQDWIGYSYVYTMAVGLRRLVDRTKGTVSLVRLLEDLKRNCTLLTRERYISLSEELFFREHAMQWWDELTGGGQGHVTRARINEMLKELKGASSAGERYANDYVTHHAECTHPNPPSFKEVRQALAVAARTCRWCIRLLRADDVGSPVPVLISDWLKSLSVPWLRDRHNVTIYDRLDKYLDL